MKYFQRESKCLLFSFVSFSFVWKKLKHRPPVIEGRSPPDRSKMTMRDLIYYLPENNPMK